MDNSWLKKVGDISDYLSFKSVSSKLTGNANRQWKPVDDEHEFSLSESLVAIAPTSDVVVLAKRAKCCVLTRASVSRDGKDYCYQLRTTLDLSGAPSSPSSNDAPMCIICLPVASQKVSTHGQAEWTCIGIGYRSGLLQMYTENGVYLFGQTFHTKPLVQMKCRTQHWLNAQCGNVAEPGDDFSILFADGVLVTIDGFGLFQLLRVVYAQQALRPSSASLNTPIPHNMLSFTKWKFSDIDNVNDFVTCGIRPMSELSALFYATFQNGADISSTNQLSHFVTAGSMPFIGCWTGQERRQAQSLLSDVTTAVTNKIVSSFSGFLSWSRQTDQQKYSSSTTEETNPVSAEAPKVLNLKSIIMDRPRVGQCIAASPNHRLAAVTDNFNRIYVLDLESNVIIKQFKGYREAQIGWVRSVQEFDSAASKHSENRNCRATQFLVIHSPRRCQVEIWGGERWERIHMTEVPASSRLIYTPHGMLGWTRSLVNDPIDSGLNSCYLLSADGPVYSVEVAFHWAVADRNRAKLLDQSLLRDLENTVKSGKIPSLSEIFAKMQLDETRDNAVQLLIRHLQKTPDQLINTITELLPLAKRLPAEEGPRFHTLCSKIITATNLFVNLQALLSDTRSTKSANTLSVAGRPGVNLDAILNTFSLKPNDRDSYRQIFETYCLVNGLKIQEECRQPSPVKPITLVDLMELLGILSKPGISQQSSDVLLGSYIFGALFHMNDFSDKCHQLDSAISLFACQLFKPIDLLRFLLSYFFSSVSPSLAVEHLSLLLSLFQMLSRLNESSSSHSFWSLCRTTCADSFAHVKALTVALIASQLSSKSRPAASQEEQSSLLELTGDWDADISASALLLATEPSTIDAGDEWSQLSTQLTVLSLFEMLVSCKTAASENQSHMEDTTTDGWDTDVRDINIFSMPQLSSSMILTSGVDLLCEHICRWVVASKFDISAFFGRIDIAAHGKSDFPLKLLTVDSTIDHLLARLIFILPTSLSSENIFAGCAWESSISWSRQEFVSSQPFLLEAAISYANLITNNVHLKCWLLQQIWSKLVRPVFQNIFVTTARLDRAPRDAELGDGITELSAEQVALFTSQLFEMLIDASAKLNSTDDLKKRAINVESVWPTPSPDKGRISLAQQAAASDVKLNNQGCLCLHLESAIVMRVIVHFRMKPAGLDHLFSHIEQSILFQDLYSAPTPPPHVLDYVTEGRSAFVLRIYKSILTAVKPPTLTFLLANCSYYDQWNELALRLIDYWHLDRSQIYGRHLAMLSCVGLSEELVQLAEKYSAVDDFNAVRFWPIVISAVGNHIARLVYQADHGARSQQLRNRLDAFTPELVHWLAECLNDQESVVLATAFGGADRGGYSPPTATLPVLGRLLALSLAQLPEAYPFYAMTLALCELVGTLQEESSL